MLGIRGAKIKRFDRSGAKVIILFCISKAKWKKDRHIVGEK
jgi:hypothetical protein